MATRTQVLPVLVLIALCVFGQASADGESPFMYFNVYSLGDIGSPAAPYHSDYQGLSGAAGSVWLYDMSLNDIGPVPSTYAIFVGGAFTMTGAVNNGGVEAGDLIGVTQFSVDGDMSGGADLLAVGGLCTGDITVAGSADIQSFTVQGSVYEGVPFVPECDHTAVSAFFTERSAFYGAMSPTQSYTYSGGEIWFDATDLVAVFEVDASVVDTAWGVKISGTEDQTVIINVTGTVASLTYMDWTLTGTIERSRILVNFLEAETLEISNIEVLGSILAPHAAVYFPSGLVQGGLWVGNLDGGGQVNHGIFIEPEPSSATENVSWGRVKALYR